MLHNLKFKGIKKVLIINASVRDEKSHSRKLTQLFIVSWKKKNRKDKITFREVGLIQVPPIDEKWITSAFIKPQCRTQENQAGVSYNNELIKE